MSIEENKKIAWRYEDEIFNQKNLDVIDEIIAPEFVNNGPQGSHTYSREGLKDMHRRMFEAIPDYHDDVHEMIAEGNIVAIRATRSGTFKGKWFELEPNGRYGSYAVSHMFRIEDGKLTECWFVYDTATNQKWLGIYGKA